MQEISPADSFRRPESVLVVIYSGTRVLLLERKQPLGFWQSVTGGLEWGERAEDCAMRELHEETGLKLNPVDTGIVNRFEIMPQWRARYAPDVRQNTEYVFQISLDTEITPRLSPVEHVSFQWMAAEEAIERCFSHTNSDAIKRIVLNR